MATDPAPKPNPPAPPGLKPTWLNASPAVPAAAGAPGAAPSAGSPGAPTAPESGIEFLCRRVSEMEKRITALTGMEERLLARLDKGFTALSQELGKAKRATTADEASPRPAPVAIPKLAQPAPWPTAGPGGVPADIEPPILRAHGGTEGGVVLLVDDDAMVRRITSVMLQKAGYLVDTANSGNAALDAIAETPGRYGAIMLDLSMPGLTGEQTYRRMLDQKIDIPVLFYSGYSYQLAELFAKYGGSRTEFLLKPFEPGQLTERIARLLPVPARRIPAGPSAPAVPAVPAGPPPAAAPPAPSGGGGPLPPVSGLPPMAGQLPSAPATPALPAASPAAKPKTAPALPRLPEIGNAGAPAAPAPAAAPSGPAGAPPAAEAAEAAEATAGKSIATTPVAALQPMVPSDAAPPPEPVAPASVSPADKPRKAPPAPEDNPTPTPRADTAAGPVPESSAVSHPAPSPGGPTPRTDEIAAEPFRGVENLPSVKTRPSPFARVSTRPLPAPEEVALTSTGE